MNRLERSKSMRINENQKSGLRGALDSGVPQKPASEVHLKIVSGRRRRELH